MTLNKNQAILSFDNTGSGLAAPKGKLKSFAIGDKDGSLCG
jgi:hypothetical protein